MKNLIKKLTPMCLLFTLILSFANISKANAFVDTTYKWGFGISSVFDSLDNSTANLSLITDRPQAYNNYELTGNTVVLTTTFNNNPYFTGFYVRVDDKFIGMDGDKGIFVDFNQVNSTTYNTAIKVTDLTPGKHKIEVRADRPFNISNGPQQKKDYVYVTVK